MGSRISAAVLVSFGLLLGLSTAAHAQSSIAGVVKDASGAVLPGVTVEVSSPALIERTRTANSDGQGQYTIIALPPGVYTISFALPGFQTIRREGVELPADFTATINGEMRLGSLEESVTVSGQSPVVDIQSTSQSQSLSSAVLEVVPTGRTIQSIAQIIPGIKLSEPDVGGAHAMQQTSISGHGMASQQTVVQLDGMGYNSVVGDGGVQVYSNTAMNEEMVYQTSGANADVDAGGVRLNMVPKRGGNVFSGIITTMGTRRNWQSDNLTDELIQRGVKAVDGMDKLYDIEGGVGGKIVQDRLWYYFSWRRFRVDTPVADTFYKDGRQGIDDQYQQSGQPRLTWQMTSKNQLTAFVDKIDKNRGHAMTAGYDPATASAVWGSPQYMAIQTKWTSVFSSKLLLENGFSSTQSSRTVKYQPGISKLKGTPEWYANASHVDTSLGTTTVAGVPEYRIIPNRRFLSSAVSYVTGSHTVKTGVQYDWSSSLEYYTMNADLYQQYQNGVPFQVQIYNTPVAFHASVGSNLGIYAQDSWKFKRLTLNYGARWQLWATRVDAQEVEPGRFVGARKFGPEDMPTMKSLDPRMGLVYDLFGTSKTALKFSVSRYQQAGTVSLANTYNPIALQTASVAWRDLNNDDIAQGERGCVYLTPGCEINLAQLPLNFGTVVPGCSMLATAGSIPCGTSQVDPNLKRTNTWNYNIGVQHELLPRIAVGANWFHVDYYNLRARENVLQSPADYTPQTVVSPLDGSVITIYNVSAAKVRSVQNLDTVNSDRKQWYNGFEFVLNARLPHGATLFGGLTTERTLVTVCDEPWNPNNLRFCDQRESGIPYRTSMKVAGNFMLPWGIRASGSLQSMAGNPEGTAALNVSTPSGIATAWQITPTTRYAANCTGPCTPGALVNPGMTLSSMLVPLTPPGVESFDRLNQLDINFGKVIQLRGKMRLEPEISIFNALNVSTVLAVRSLNFGTASYQQPSSILQGRFVRLGIALKW
jgi:hypothetical protein